MPRKVPFVDSEACIGCSACAALAPAVFEIQEDGKSKVVNGEGDTEENIQRSIDTCPVMAISWTEETPVTPTDSATPAVSTTSAGTAASPSPTNSSASPNGQEKKKEEPMP